MSPRRYPAAIFGALAWVCVVVSAPNQASAQTPLNERVLVVYNSNGDGSLAVARYYMDQRKIPQANRCKISVSSAERVDQVEFESRVKTPVRQCLAAAGKQKILYIVFSYQTPYALMLQDRVFALDQFVADIWDEYGGMRPGSELGPHPYFGEAQSQKNLYKPFVPLAAYRDQPRALTVYSVWRLDAANADLAKRLVYYAMFAETHGLSGRGCFDRQFAAPLETLADSGAAAGDWDVHQAAEFSRRAGFPVTEDGQAVEFGTPPAPLRCDGAAFYAGWYSLNHYNDAFTWVPGAIGFHLDSASATDPRGGSNWSANAVMKGITITSGAVGEPFLEGLTHPDQAFLYLFQGANVGDAVLRSTRWLKWMIVNIGDPLYRPFPQGIAPFGLPVR
ncbi:MAG: TIGR03790 family protein [Candidatus Solibacter sp.]|nr:TIGR03790 family protein [Candidatus Solibacter sp.]